MLRSAVALQQILFREICVLSAPEHQTGTRIPIKSYCKFTGIRHFEAPFKSLKGWNLPDSFDFGIVISFGYFIPKRILACFPSGIINMHPSLLPKFRGPAPILHTLAAGEQIGGLSIIELHPERFDAGKILSQVAFPIVPPKALYSQYEDLIVQRGIAELVQVIARFPCFEANAWRQNEELASHAPKITREFAMISFYTASKFRIENLYRAISHIHKLECKFHFNSKILTVKLAEIDLTCDLNVPLCLTMGIGISLPAGSVLLDKRQNVLWIKCCEKPKGVNEWLAVRKFKVEGKNLLYDAKQFSGGYQVKAFEKRFE